MQSLHPAKGRVRLSALIFYFPESNQNNLKENVQIDMLLIFVHLKKKFFQGGHKMTSFIGRDFTVMLFMFF